VWKLECLRNIKSGRTAWHKGTVVEPGGFRADFAGSSTGFGEGRLEYDVTVSATGRFQRNYDRKKRSRYSGPYRELD